MLHDDRHQFGVDFAQDPPRFGAGPLIQQAVLFPQLEEQFNLPAHSHQDQRLGMRQHLSGHVGHQDRPRGQSHLPGTDRFAMILRLFAQALLPLLDNRIGHPFAKESNAFDRMAGPQIHLPLQATSHLLWQQLEDICGLLISPQRRAIFVAHQEIHAFLDQRTHGLRNEVFS